MPATLSPSASEASFILVGEESQIFTRDIKKDSVVVTEVRVCVCTTVHLCALCLPLSRSSLTERTHL